MHVMLPLEKSKSSMVGLTPSLCDFAKFCSVRMRIEGCLLFLKGV